MKRQNEPVPRIGGVSPRSSTKTRQGGNGKSTVVFIGVNTAGSLIMNVLPKWAKMLHLGDCAIQGLDLPPHAGAAAYRRVFEQIRSEPTVSGAVITTHKVDLFNVCKDLFDEVADFARLAHEVSCISKCEGRIAGHAKDPLTSGLALESFLPDRHWARTGAEVLVLGAGGASAAVTSYLLRKEHGANRPSRILVSDCRLPRLREIERIHRALGVDLPVEYVHTPRPEDNDRLAGQRLPRSLVINATGLGKDAPGSPLTDAVVFPSQGMLWDFNYRGDLGFLRQGRAQQEKRGLLVEDGWEYFLHGWLQAIAEIFHCPAHAKGPVFEELKRIASRP